MAAAVNGASSQLGDYPPALILCPSLPETLQVSIRLFLLSFCRNILGMLYTIDTDV